MSDYAIGIQQLPPGLTVAARDANQVIIATAPDRADNGGRQASEPRHRRRLPTEALRAKVAVGLAGELRLAGHIQCPTPIPISIRDLPHAQSLTE